jgi:hypothetical protein
MSGGFIEFKFLNGLQISRKRTHPRSFRPPQPKSEFGSLIATFRAGALVATGFKRMRKRASGPIGSSPRKISMELLSCAADCRLPAEFRGAKYPGPNIKGSLEATGSPSGES